MQLSLSVDSIYEGSLCKLTASSHHQFDLSTNTRTLKYEKGIPADISGNISSIEDKGKHQVEVSLIGAVKEKRTGYGDSGSASQYGMSYFPFISSHISLNIIVSHGLSDIVFDIPANFRIIWNTAIAVSPSGEKSSLSTSYGEKTSTYIFSWLENQSGGIYTIDFDVRTGGPGLLRAAYFPIYYYFIALVAVAAAGTAEKVNILLGAIAATWIFLLRHINTCDIPRRNVFLSFAAFLLGVFLLIWGVTWKILRNSHSVWIIVAIVIEVIISIAGIWGALVSIRCFETNGILPLWITRFWGHFVQNLEERQRRNRG